MTPIERDDGIHPYSGHEPNPRYNDYAARQRSGRTKPVGGVRQCRRRGKDGDLLVQGWFLKYADRPARVPDPLSETPYITTRAMNFIDEALETEP